MKTIKKFCALVVCALASLPSMAQQTYQEMEQLTINENVTTVITASEPVRFVDISTDAVVGDQPINNTIRLKPKEGAAVHADGDRLRGKRLSTKGRFCPKRHGYRHQRQRRIMDGKSQEYGTPGCPYRTCL